MTMVIHRWQKLIISLRGTKKDTALVAIHMTERLRRYGGGGWAGSDVGWAGGGAGGSCIGWGTSLVSTFFSTSPHDVIASSSINERAYIWLLLFIHTIFTLTGVWRDQITLCLRASQLDGGAPPPVPFIHTDKRKLREETEKKRKEKNG